MQHKQNLSFFTKSYFFNITKLLKNILQKPSTYITQKTTKKHLFMS